MTAVDQLHSELDHPLTTREASNMPAPLGPDGTSYRGLAGVPLSLEPVSYTHLTLPTILLV